MTFIRSTFHHFERLGLRFRPTSRDQPKHASKFEEVVSMWRGLALKSLEDWTLEKSFKQVPGVVDVASFGGPTKEYQIKLNPEKLISYGLSIGQIEQQISSNNSNGGGSFIEQGSQQINVQTLGLYSTVQDIENTVVKTQNGAPIRIRDIATVEQGPKIRLGQIGRAWHRPDGSIVKTDRDALRPRRQ